MQILLAQEPRDKQGGQWDVSEEFRNCVLAKACTLGIAWDLKVERMWEIAMGMKQNADISYVLATFPATV